MFLGQSQIHHVVPYTKMRLVEGRDIRTLAWDNHVSNIRCEMASKGKLNEAYCMGLDVVDPSSVGRNCRKCGTQKFLRCC